jgi:hypothetical protein
MPAYLASLYLPWVCSFWLMGPTQALTSTETTSFGKDKAISTNILWSASQRFASQEIRGGLGVLNTKMMNIALLTKWIWRLLSSQDENLLWVRLIKAKYQVQDLFSANPAGGSPFWHSIHKIKDHFKLGAKFILGDGASIKLWTDH